MRRTTSIRVPERAAIIIYILDWIWFRFVLVGWSAGRLGDWLVGLVGWLGDWFVGFGWLIGRLIGG